MDQSPSESLPYPPSWINRLTSWVETISVPSWMFYPGLLLLSGFLFHLLSWREGVIRPGSIDVGIFLGYVLTYGSLALHHYLEVASRDALHETKPLLGISEEAFSNLNYEFTILPERAFLIWSLSGFILGTVNFLLFENLGFGFIYIVMMYLSFALQGLVVTGLFYRVIRTTRMIYQIYATAPNVNLFSLSPVYSLSSLSAKIGLALLFMMYFEYALYPEFMREMWVLALLGFTSLVPLAAFFLPLRGINRRLIDEKKRLLSDTSRRLETILKRIKHTMDSDDLKGLGDLEIALRTLRSEKEVVEKILTWPWRPGTIRVFLSAIFLPMFLWVIQRIFENLLGL